MLLWLSCSSSLDILEEAKIILAYCFCEKQRSLYQIPQEFIWIIN